MKCDRLLEKALNGQLVLSQEARRLFQDRQGLDSTSLGSHRMVLNG